jgi:hypothetical protein
VGGGAGRRRDPLALEVLERFDALIGSIQSCAVATSMSLISMTVDRGLVIL